MRFNENLKRYIMEYEKCIKGTERLCMNLLLQCTLSSFKIQNPKFDNTAMQNSHIRRFINVNCLELLNGKQGQISKS